MSEITPASHEGSRTPERALDLASARTLKEVRKLFGTLFPREDSSVNVSYKEDFKGKGPRFLILTSCEDPREPESTTSHIDLALTTEQARNLHEALGHHLKMMEEDESEQ